MSDVMSNTSPDAIAALMKDYTSVFLVFVVVPDCHCCYHHMSLMFYIAFTYISCTDGFNISTTTFKVSSILAFIIVVKFFNPTFFPFQISVLLLLYV